MVANDFLLPGCSNSQTFYQNILKFSDRIQNRNNLPGGQYILQPGSALIFLYIWSLVKNFFVFYFFYFSIAIIIVVIISLFNADFS